MFLQEYPDGSIRKEKSHLQGHVYPSNWTSLKRNCHESASALLNISSEDESEEQISAPEVALIEGISHDEWSFNNE